MLLWSNRNRKSLDILCEKSCKNIRRFFAFMERANDVWYTEKGENAFE